jgi:hypothetical protein
VDKDRYFRKRKHDLRFISPANAVMRVVVFKRPFLSYHTTSVWVRFLRLSFLSHKKLEEDLEELGLTPPQFYVLATIGYAGGLPFGEIGAKMKVTVSNILWYHRERGQNSNLDRCLGLRANRHRQKTTQPTGHSLRTATDSESNSIRENPAYSATYPNRHQSRTISSSKPIEFIQITLGHY